MKEKVTSRFTRIEPDSKVRKVFDFLEAVNILYISIFLPLQVGFALELEGLLLAAEIVSWMFSLLLILVNFRTPYEYRGRHTLNFKIIIKHYYHDLGLVWDVIGALPLNIILGLAAPHSTHIVVCLFRLVRFSVLFKTALCFQKLELMFRRHNYFI